MRRTHRTPTALAVMTVLLVTGALGGCSSNDDAAAPSVTSKARSTTTTAERSTTTTTGSDPGSTGGLDDLGNLPGIDALGDCADVVLAYTQLAVTVIQGDQAAAKVDEVMAKVRTKVPAELQDDLQKVGDGYAAAAKAGLLNAGKVLDDPEFKKANKAVGDYLRSECATGGN